MPKRRPRDTGTRAYFDIDRIIAALGGIEPLIVEHRDLGFPQLTRGAVASWRHRRNAPSDRLAEVLYTLEVKRGADIRAFMRVIR